MYIVQKPGQKISLIDTLYNFANLSVYLKFGEGDPWAGQVRDKDSRDSEVISESLESRVTLGAEPPIGSWQAMRK